MGSELYQSLCEPFPIQALHWRLGATDAKRNDGIPQNGVPLAYIDARDVMNRLDEIVGPFGWQTKMQEVAGTCAVSLGVLIEGEWVWRTDTAGQTDVEGEKGAASTALRRAAAQFGIGRYLYRLENKWVPLKAQGKCYAGSFKGVGRLFFDPPELPPWAVPNGEGQNGTSRSTGVAASVASETKGHVDEGQVQRILHDLDSALHYNESTHTIEPAVDMDAIKAIYEEIVSDEVLMARVWLEIGKWNNGKQRGPGSATKSWLKAQERAGWR